MPAVLFGIAITHILLSWGYGGLFWGDEGRWLHEIDRFAHGEVPYRDFTWAFPPLSMWVLGSYARVFGSDLTPIWVATSTVFLAIVLLYGIYVTDLLERRLAAIAAVPALVFAFAQVNSVGGPLPLGAYSPAAPIGFLCLLGATLVAIRGLDHPTWRLAAGLGVLTGLCVLAKQDFWIPAVYLLVVFAVTTWRSGHRNRSTDIAVAAITFAIIVCAGAGLVVASAGLATLLKLPGGFGSVTEFSGRRLPSWERLTTEILAISLLTALVMTCLGIAGAVRRSVAIRASLVAGSAAAASVAIYVGVGLGLAASVVPGPTLPTMASYVASLNARHEPVLAGILRFMLDATLDQALPVILPGLALLLLFVRRGALRDRPGFRQIAVLLGLCVAARLRRLFQQVEWYHFLLEIPVYLLLIQLLLPKQEKRVRAALVMALVSLTVVASGAYWYVGRGPLTRRVDWEQVRTPRGAFRMPAQQALEYHDLVSLLARVDPSGTRPLFAFGYSGGFNYFLARENPTPLTQGFRLSNADPRSVVDRLIEHNPPVLLLDVFGFAMPKPSSHIGWTTWETPTAVNPYVRFDRPLFEEVLRHCTRAGQVPANGRAQFTLYSCGR